MAIVVWTLPKRGQQNTAVRTTTDVPVTSAVPDEKMPISTKPDGTKDLSTIAKEAIAAAYALGLRDQQMSEYAARALRAAHGGLTSKQAFEIAEKHRMALNTE